MKSLNYPIESFFYRIKILTRAISIKKKENPKSNLRFM